MRTAAVALIACVLVISTGSCGSAAPPKTLPRALEAPAPAPAVSSAVPSAATLDAGTAQNSSIGTAHPLVLEAAAPDGHWAVVCQARADTNGDGRIGATLGPRGELGGDLFESYLVIGAGSGERIDELVGYDNAGRYVAVVLDARLIVIDTVRGERIDLGAKGADPRTDASSHRAHRAAGFDAAGKQLVYLKKQGGHSFAVVRELETGSEIPVDAGPGEIWRAELTSAGLVLRLVVDDTNHNGRLELPAPLVTRNRWRCQGPFPSYAAFQDYGDAPRTYLVGPNGALREIPGYVSAFGQGILRREPDGRLVLERASGSLVLAEGRCGARVLHADPARERLLVACTAAPGRSPVRLLGPRLRLDLGVSVEPRSVDRAPEATPRLVALQPGADDVLVDLERQELVRLEPGSTVIATYEHRALLRKGRELFLFDGQTRKESKLPGELSEAPDYLRQPPLVFMTPLVVDLAEGALLGSVAKGARPLALTTDGRPLVPARPTSDKEVALGPLSFGALENPTMEKHDRAVNKMTPNGN